MAKQLNVNLAFTADTGQAKAQIMQLQQQLTNLVNIAGKQSGQFTLTKELQQATTVAAQLKAQLQSATDVNTGKLDLTKFTQSMTESGMSLKKYQQQLSQLGPEGDKAFASLAASINNADARLRNANTMLGQFATTLKNTARWQISSSMLHGFMGALQGAYGYAQDLNGSLNNIRIVTGQSTEEMAGFAERANKAAQALSTTTTSYTDAALIYYQQGIRDQEEIAARTETTIKLANVSRQSAEEVSQEMTAIWNNFYDGSESLEHYADVITALGAATASSSQEIAAGLEKFAAIADTVGLSYDYATAAMATITAQTRQSADTVGTGLRTLFSRLESLKLGDTLEDGVDLNKYSQALDAVGVKVLDVSGELRNMDDILDDLGDRWGDLSKAQQVALAQTVGGVRQYTNLIALMDNWDKMKENVLIAEGAEGTLQEQADIYAESWEGAQKRVRAAWEAIYQSILDDKFFIGLANGFAGFLHVIDDAVDGLGGMKGTLLLIGTIITKIFNQDLTNGIAKLTSSFQLAMMGGQQYVEQQRQAANDILARTNIEQGTLGGANIAASYQAQGELQNAYLKSAQNMTAEQQTIAQLLLDQNKALGENVRLQAEAAQEAEKEAVSAERELALTTRNKQARTEIEDSFKNKRQSLQQMGAANEIDTRLAIASKDIKWNSNNQDAIKQFNAELMNLEKGFEAVGESAESILGKRVGSIFERLKENSSEGSVHVKALKQAWQEWTDAMGNSGQNLEAFINKITAIKAEANGIQQGTKEWKELRAEVEAAAQSYIKVGQSAAEGAAGVGTLQEQARKAAEEFANFQMTVSQRVGQGIMAASSALMSFGMALSSIKSLGSIWSDEDASLGDKIISTMTSLGIVTMSLTSALKAENIEKIKSALLNKQELASLFGLKAMKTEEGAIIWQTVGAKVAETAATGAQAGANLVEATSAEVDAAANTGLAAAIWEVVKARLAGLSAMIPYIAALGAAVAVVAIAGAGIKALVNALHSEENAAEKAREAVEDLTEKTSEAKQAASELKDTIDTYDSCVEKLENCTKGTKEWRDALKETNRSAIETLNTIGDFLSSEDYQQLVKGFKENGTLDPSILNKAQSKADTAAADMEYATALADYKAVQAELVVESKNLAKEIRSASLVDDNFALNAMTGANQENIKDNLSYLSEALDVDDLRERFKTLGIDVTYLSDNDLIRWQDEINSMSDTALKAAEKFALIAGIKVDEIAGDQYTDTEKAYAASQAENSYTSVLKWQDRAEKLASLDNSVQTGVQAEMRANNEDYYQEMADAMSKILGATVTKAQNGSYQNIYAGDKWKEDKGKIFFDVDGQRTGYTPEEVGNMIAASLSESEIKQDLNEARQFLDGASKDMKTFADSAMQNFDSQNNKFDFGQFAGDKTKAELDALEGLTGDKLLKALSLDSDKIAELADMYGLTQEELINQLEADINQSIKDFDFKELSKGLSGSAKKLFQETIDSLGDVTLNEAKSIKQHMDDIYMNNHGDTSKQEAYVDFLTAIKENGGDVAKFEESLNKIDWKYADVNDLADALEEAGVESEVFANQLAHILGIFKSIAPEDDISPEERYKAVTDITSDLAPKKEITQAEYDTLDKYGLDVENFFSKTASGTYMFTGSVEELQAALQEGDVALGGFTDKINDLKNEAIALEAFQNGKDLSGHQQIVQGKTGEAAVEANEDLGNKIGAVNAFAEESGMKPRELARINEEFAKRDEDTGEYTGKLTPDQIEALDQAYQNLKNTLSDEQIEERLKNIKDEQAQLNEQQKTSAIADDMDIAKVKEYNDYLKENAKNLDWVDDTLAENEEALLDTAAAWEDCIEGIEAIQKEWKNWNKMGLKTPEVLGEISDVLSDMFNQDVSQDFIADHLEEIQRLAEGDMTAIDDLGIAIAENQALQRIPIGFDQESWNNQVNDVFNTINEIGLEDIQVGAKIENAGFYDDLNSMLVSMEATQEEANAILGGIGYNPNITMKEVKIDNMQQSSTDGSYTMTYSGLDGSTGGTVTVDEHFANEHQNGDTITIPVIEGSTFAGRAAGAGHSGRTGGGGGGGGCFLAGTLISTFNGFCPIEKIKVGDIVLSYNTKTQQNEYSEVLETMIHVVNGPIYTLFIRDDQLKVTGIHRFYINRNSKLSWVHAQNLKIGDLVLFADGIWHPILNIEKEDKILQVVYNFEVSHNHNYYVGQNRILAHNKGGRRGRRAERNRAALKKPDEGKERYHVVKNQLQSIEGQLKKIDTAYNRAFGKEKLSLLDQQIKKQKDLVAKQKEYVDEIKRYQAADKKALEGGTTKFWSETDGKMKTINAGASNYLHKTIQYDNDNNITNYDELIEANNAAFNKATKKYNKAKKGDKKAEREYEIAKAQYESFNELLKQYEDTEDLLIEEQQKLQEEQNKIYDMLLEKVQLTVTIKVEVQEDSLKLLDFYLERIQDDAYKAAERISLIGEKATASMEKIKAYREGLAGILSNHNMDGTAIVDSFMNGTGNIQAVIESIHKSGDILTQAEADAIREYTANILAESSQLAEYRKSIIEDIGTVMEENIRRLDRITDKMEHLKKVTSSYKNIVDLTGRQFLKITSDLYKKIEETNVKLATQSLNMSKQRKEQAEAELAFMQSQYASVVGSISPEENLAWQKRLEEAEDYVQEMTEDYYSSWEEAIEAVNTKFQSTMERMAEDFSKQMAGAAGNLEGLKNRFDLKKEVSDTYVPEYEKMYQLTKLIRDAQKQIDESGNIKVKQELRKIQEDILAARESEAKISQYEIDYLQKELELKAAQMALEEASQIKSQVRMSRDNEGNYSYVYTADEQAVEEAEQNYSDKLYEMQKLNEEYIYNLQGQLQTLEEGYIQAMQEAADIYGIETEEYYQAIQNIQEDYQEYFGNLVDELNLSLENQMEVSTIHAEIYEALTGDVFQANVDLTTSWDETVLAALTGIETLTEYEQNWALATTEVYQTAKEAAQDWHSEIDDVYTAAGTTVDEFKETLEDDLDAVQDKGEETASNMESALEDVQGAIEQVTSAVAAWEQQYSETVTNMLTKNAQLVESFNSLLASWSGVEKAVAERSSSSNRGSGRRGGGRRSNRGSGRRSSRGSRRGGSGSRGSSGSNANAIARNATRRVVRAARATTRAITQRRTSLWTRVKRAVRRAYNNATSSKVGRKFDTGGYTGDWAGNEGKVAILHSKELVLNKEDTANILQAVGTVREISKAIDINAMASGGAFSALNAPALGANGRALEQDVHITAEFPNATDRNEILAAFDNVINLASQYANR